MMGARKTESEKLVLRTTRRGIRSGTWRARFMGGKAERTKESGLAGMGGAAAASRNGGDPLSRGLRRGPGGGARASGPNRTTESTLGVQATAATKLAR
jgi:hypothetical protein